MEYKKRGEKTNKVEKEIGGSLIKLELKQKKIQQWGRKKPLHKTTTRKFRGTLKFLLLRVSGNKSLITFTPIPSPAPSPRYEFFTTDFSFLSVVSLSAAVSSSSKSSNKDDLKH